MKKLKAVIFDVDGTLAETEREGHRVAFNQAFQDAGLDLYWDENLYGQLLAVAGGKERLRYYLSEFNTAFQCDNVDALVKELHASKTRHYVSLLERKQISLRTGVERLINEIRETGIRLAIATTTTPENVTTLVKSTLGEEALDWFDCIAAGDVVAAKKPAPDIFEYCLQQMNLMADDCLAFEDSENGVRAACAAGIPTVVTMNQYTKYEDFSGAICVLNHLGDENRPCHVVAGASIMGEYITIDELKRLHDSD